jgi:hypothetical protein
MSTQSSDFLATGPGPYGFDSAPILQFGVRGRGQITGVYGWGQSYGVYAEGGLNGVRGFSNAGTGVFGQSGTKTFPFGLGINPSNAGVVGWSDANSGVEGSSRTGFGVHGMSTTVAVNGFSLGGVGVSGFSDTGVGVQGVADAANGIAVKGMATGGGIAGLFEGPVAVASGGLSVGGGLIVFGGLNVVSGMKHAVVPFPDGSQRLLCCMENPEPWFEDFGSAKLRRGRATVQLNDFANVIITSDYRVFLSPEGDCNGLYVARKRGAAFEVRELGGGRSSVAFSYRIVGSARISRVVSASTSSRCRSCPRLPRWIARRRRCGRHQPRCVGSWRGPKRKRAR